MTDHDRPAAHPRSPLPLTSLVAQVTTFTAAYDGGITLTKHDCFPPEDPAIWISKTEEKWFGEFRQEQEGLGSEDW